MNTNHVTRSRDLRLSFILFKVSDWRGRLVKTASDDVSIGLHFYIFSVGYTRVKTGQKIAKPVIGDVASITYLTCHVTVDRVTKSRDLKLSFILFKV